MRIMFIVQLLTSFTTSEKLKNSKNKMTRPIEAPTTIGLSIVEIVDDLSDNALVNMLAGEMVKGLPFAIRNGTGQVEVLTGKQKRKAEKETDKAHNRRTIALVTAMRQASPGTKIDHFLECDYQIYTEHSLEHFDGLNFPYVQVHTTRPNAELTGSTAIFRAYPASEARHAGLVEIRNDMIREGIMPNSNAMLSVNPQSHYWKLMMDILGHKHGEPTVYAGSTGPQETFIFPNGYNALSDVAPQVLWTHEFFSGSQADLSESRRAVALSRVESR